MKHRVAIAGASGFLGNALRQYLVSCQRQICSKTASFCAEPPCADGAERCDHHASHRPAAECANELPRSGCVQPVPDLRCSGAAVTSVAADRISANRPPAESQSCSKFDVDTTLAGREEFAPLVIPREWWSCAQQPLPDCESLVMAAGVSRAADVEELYRINMTLAHTLVERLEAARWRGRLYFISTTHEPKDTPYHASKRDSRACFDAWAARSGGSHTGILLPNTFGPGGKIAYNSAVCTFAWQLTHGIEPTILADAPVALCDIAAVTAQLTEWLLRPPAAQPVAMAPCFEYRVSEIVARLRRLASGAMAQDAFDRALAATLAYARTAAPYSPQSSIE